MSHPVSEDHAQDPSPVTLENAFAQGLQCLRGKDYIGAIESFEAVLEIDPEHAYARYLKGKAHYLMKQYDDSIDELQDAIDIVAPRHLDVKRGISHFYMGLFNQLVVDSEDDKKKLEQIAFATDEPLAVASTFNRGLSAYYLNAHERAINEFGKVINQDPTFSQAFLFRGTALHHLKLYERAIADFNRCVKLEPSAVAYYNLALAYCNLTQYEKAIEFFTLSLTHSPNDPQAYNNRGVAWRHLKQYSKAIADFGLAITLDPNYAPAYNNRGLCYKDTGDLHRAVMDFTACIQLKPNDQRFFNRATTYCTLQNWTDAITDLSNAISFNPTDAAYFLTRAGVFAQTGQHTKAVDDFGSAVSADPTDHRSYLMRGLYKKSQGDRKGAYTDVDMALKLSQKIAGALEALGLGLDIA